VDVKATALLGLPFDPLILYIKLSFKAIEVSPRVKEVRLQVGAMCVWMVEKTRDPIAGPLLGTQREYNFVIVVIGRAVVASR
jgi:hypothetical protein